MDGILALAGLGVGTVIGLTGMGGGALMTPILVLFFGIPPLAAVSSDLLASAVIKPFGGLIHARRRTVQWRMIAWLCAGSVPSAFSGVLIMRALGGSNGVEHAVRTALGVALMVAIVGMFARPAAAALRARRGRRADTPDGGSATLPNGRSAHLPDGRSTHGAAADAADAHAVGADRQGAPASVPVRPVPTLLVGALGGVIVGMTSVGSGSLIIVALLLLYPALRANDLVGTDLIQAVPLVAAAAIGHAFFGDLHLEITGSLLVGAIPGVLLGATLSSRAPARLVRTALAVVLLASALKLLDASNQLLVIAVVGAIAVAVSAHLRRRARHEAVTTTTGATVAITRTVQPLGAAG